MKKEFKRIKGVGKEVVGKDNFRKIKKIKDYSDRTESLKYMIHSKLELEYLDLEQKLGEIKKDLLLEARLKRLRHKIDLFKVTHEKKDYSQIERLIQELKGEIKENV